MVCCQGVWCCMRHLNGLLPHNKFIHASSTLALLISIVVLYCILPTYVSGHTFVYTSIRSPQRCDIIREPSELKPAKHLYFENEDRPITIATSERPGHQLLTEVVAVLMRQLLGYEISIHTYSSAPDEHDSVLFSSPLLHKSVSYEARRSTHEQHDKMMIDLLVWNNPSEVVTFDSDDATSYLGIGGRFGWYLPSHVLTGKRLLLEHWRTYTVPGGEAVRRFHRTEEELAALSPLLHDLSGVPHCGARDGCRNGLFTPPWCERQLCALLFASDVATSGFLKMQIRDEHLYVRVAFLGPNLTTAVVNDNAQLPDGRSMLLFHWTPSLLLQSRNFTSISFPSCTLEENTYSYLCHYELHRFNKHVWSKLKIYATNIFNALERVVLDGPQFSSLLEESGRHPPGTPLHELACNWINTHDVWRDWRFFINPVDLMLVGIFPMSVDRMTPTTTSSPNTTDVDAKPQKTRTHWLVKDKYIAPGNVPAFQMAIEAVNANTSILADYRLMPVVFNGACEADLVMASFIQIVSAFSKEGRLESTVGIVGPACSDTVVPLAGVTKHYSIPIISYGAEGAIFTERNEYPYFFRTIPENKIYRYVYYELFIRLGWKRISSLTEDGQRYSEYITPLHELLESYGMVFVMRKYRQEIESMNMAAHLQFLRDQRATVIIGDFYEDVARIIMCEAFKSNMTACQGYVWFLPQWYSQNWYNVTAKPEATALECTSEELLQALEGHMTLSYQFLGEPDQIMQENITVHQWYQKYLKATAQTRVAPSDYAGFTYDAVWSYALALDRMAQQQRQLMYDLRSTESTDFLIKSLESLKFLGASGEVSFLRSHSRLTDVVVRQFAHGRYVDVAQFVVDSANITNSRLELNSSLLSWPCGMPTDKPELCVVEGFRRVLGANCTTAIVLLCFFMFIVVGAVPLLCIYFIKRNYDLKMQVMQAELRTYDITAWFDGCQIQREDLVINRQVGEGQAGVIYGGECNFQAGGWVPIAAKKLKNPSKSQKISFFTEADLMRKLQHENIVRLLGVCQDKDVLYAVMEFMLHRDLKNYLLARRHLVYNRCRADNDEVSNKRLTAMVRDVARALQYLAENKYVHRDIASRNCLVNAQLVVKICDFGMTRPVFETSYYRFKRKDLLPVRWMAPESLIEGLYTSKSDMWSYGVLIYEVITFGTIPFRNLTSNEVFEYVRNRNTLRPPPGIHPLLEAMLMQCWQFSPSRRPTALQMVNTLTNNPSLVSPSLDSPETSVEAESGNTVQMQPVLPRHASLGRRLSLHPPRLSNTPAPPKNISRQSSVSSSSSVQPSGGLVATTSASGGLFSSVSNSRKRSMSGNMAVPSITCSLSDSTIGSPLSGYHHNTLDALNLSVTAVVMEERPEDATDVNTAVSNNAVVAACKTGVGVAGHEMGQQSGDSSGYSSTCTGTGGSNASNKKAESSCANSGYTYVSNLSSNCPLMTDSGSEWRTRGIPSSGARGANCFNNRTESNGDTRRSADTSGKGSKGHLINSGNMFYLPSNERTFEFDEGAIPLLPQVGYSADGCDYSGDRLCLSSRSRSSSPASRIVCSPDRSSSSTATIGSITTA